MLQTRANVPTSKSRHLDWKGGTGGNNEGPTVDPAARTDGDLKMHRFAKKKGSFIRGDSLSKSGKGGVFGLEDGGKARG